MPPRIGVVPYLNSVPLVRDLEDDSSVELVWGTPAEIADMLARNELALGLTPIVEAARLRLSAVAGLGVAGCGAVKTVLLLSKVPVPAIATLALDPASRSSAALLRLLLRRVHRLTPRIVAGPPSGAPLPADADAALLIGDRALLPIDPGLTVVDLGQWWHDYTGQPFVFAMWAGPDPLEVAQLGPRLIAARDRGLARLPTLIAYEATRRNLPIEVVDSYLRESILFLLGQTEHDALQTYLQMLREDGILPGDARLGLVTR